MIYRHTHADVWSGIQKHMSHSALLFDISMCAFITFLCKWLIAGDLADDYRCIHTPIPSLNCLHKHTDPFHTYRSIFLHSPMLHCTQLVFLFHQCGMSFLSRLSYCRLYCETSVCGASISYFFIWCTMFTVNDLKVVDCDHEHILHCLFHFGWCECLCSRRCPTVHKLLLIIITLVIIYT